MMNQFYKEDLTQRREGAKGPAPEMRLSEAIGRFLLAREQKPVRLSTLALDRQSAWSLVEFLGADPTIGELRASAIADDTGRLEASAELPSAAASLQEASAELPSTAERWLKWLRETPWIQRKRGSYPTQFTPATVSAFLTWKPASRSSGKFRNERTIGRFWRQARPLLDWLGLDVVLAKASKPRTKKAKRLVPTRGNIGTRWDDVIAGTSGTACAADRRRVVLLQGLVLCTGMRIEECLVASREWLEGHWLLITDSKTHQPRVIYVTGQGLAIIEALRGNIQQGMPWAADRFQRVSAWPWSKGRWHRLVGKCGLHGKSHQILRQRLTTWLRAAIFRRGLDPAIECAQLGHGGGVIIENYLDYLRPLPRLLGHFELPEVRGFQWPEAIQAGRHVPDRLLDEQDRLMQAAVH